MGRGSPYMLAGPNGRTGMSASMQKKPLWQEERRYKRRGERPEEMQKTHDRKMFLEDGAS